MAATPRTPDDPFADGRAILDFAWSRDGTRLAVARAKTTTDIVLFRGLRGRPPAS